MARVVQTIRQKLEDALLPTHLEIVDDSGKHAGHSGARPGGETHFRVKIVSEDFEGIPPLKRHKMVYAILEKEMATVIHALSIQAFSANEYAAETVAA